MTLIFVFYVFAALLVFLGWKSLRGGLAYLHFFESELTKKSGNYHPFASIFVPCRGIDENLEENLSALTRQNYPEFEIIFIVDDERDPALSVIEKIRKNHPLTKLVIAGPSDSEGQKVHNLRAAIPYADKRSEIFVFVDSDAGTSKNWLCELVAPLEKESAGCATGYRWFLADRFDLAGQLRSVWNASIASALGPNIRSNFCWGGSMAISRKVFESVDMLQKWKGTLSDDFAMTRAMKAANLPVIFVPQCLTPTIDTTNIRQMLEFTTRQMKITKTYAKHLWIASFIGSILFSMTFWGGILMLFFAEGVHFWIILSLTAIITILGALKSYIRLKAVELVMPEHRKAVNNSRFWHLTLWTVTPVLYFYNCFCALLSNEINWRGITYKLISAEETQVVESNKNGMV